MTLNPLNMQISVPRTPDVSNIQQQSMLKPVVDQTELAQQAIKHTEHTRTQTQKANEAEKGLIRDEGKSKQQHQQQQRKNNNQALQSDEQKPIHPYKGHSIDIKL